jgi:UPF0271 protein
VGRTIDLNADIGEGAAEDAALLEVVTSVSVACGRHAGDPALMVETARRAAAQGVAVGAHPSYDDRPGFGRHPMDVPRSQLVALVAYQVGAMATAASLAGTALRFVKPHGALYNQAALDPVVADAVVEAVSASPGGLSLLCPAASALAAAASQRGVAVYAEAFVDRAYAADGTLVPRSAAGAVLTDESVAVAQAVALANGGVVTADDGSALTVAADSLCIHGDTPGAARLARAVRLALEESGVTVARFAS